MSNDADLWKPLLEPVITERDVEALKLFLTYYGFPIRPKLASIFEKFEQFFEIPEADRPEFPVKLQEVLRDELAHSMSVDMNHKIFRPDNVKHIQQRFKEKADQYLVSEHFDEIISDPQLNQEG